MEQWNTLVKLENVAKTYQLDGVAIEALKDISLSIDKGEFAAIMGPSGSGKSTLMNLIGLLDIPTEGQIYLKGEDIAKMSPNRRAHLRNQAIGFVFQQFNLLQRVSALENVLLPLIYRSGTLKNPRVQVMETLSLVGLEDRADHHPNQLSGGQQQRVAIARALINDPEIILADEPTGNLDTKTGTQIMNILKDLHAQGRTVVTITHEQHIAEYAERIVRIVDGKIVN